LIGPPVAQKLPPVQAALLPQWQVPVDESHHSPLLQQPAPQLGPALLHAPAPDAQS
jgi:hypothetical protein